MKKVLSLIVILVSLFAGRAGTAQAAGLITYAGGRFILGKGIVFVFKASGFKRRNIKNASIYVGSNFHNLSCSVNRDEGKIVCVARGGLSDEYGGESGIIHLAGQIFYVTIPYRIERPESDEESGCEEPEVLGAKVQFEDVDGSSFTQFIPGDSLDEVEGGASEEVIVNELAGYQVVGALSCGFTPEEEL